MTEKRSEHKRRVRYRGKNPRRFEERYKEHDPEKYPEAAAHIEAKGNTLAGTHRPICVEEIFRRLDPKPGECALDATLGYGGHAEQLLPRLLPGGKLFAVDADPIEMSRTEARMRKRGFDEDVLVIRQMNFSAIRSLLYEAGGGFDCILADLGVSSMQLDNPTRGFSHKSDGPLDLRLNPNKGRSAKELLAAIDREELEAILESHADESYAKVIAQAIKVSKIEITRTTQLAEIIRTSLKRYDRALGDHEIKRSIQRSFMALRIEVNSELASLERFLKVLPHCLKPGGRVAILSFHSGEDRRVKNSLQEAYHLGYYSQIADGPERPSPTECRDNPRATCAKWRWAVRSELEISNGL